MTADRERTLEEALRRLERVGTEVHNSGLVDMSLYPEFAGALGDASAALASPAQEPALRSADVEEVALACANALMQVSPAICLFPRSKTEAVIAKHITAALRRHAGEGGVTDEQVETACETFVSLLPGHTPFASYCSELRESWMTRMRASLEAAARAKSDS